MGREIRRVPADWEHPKAEQPWGYAYTPLFDLSFQQAFDEWQSEMEAWFKGEAKYQSADDPRTVEGYVRFAGVSPDPEDYRPDWPEESRTHYQVYETVSEGTPISPPLPSPEAVIEWLVENPDRVHGPISREAAEAFVNGGFAPSMVFIPGRGLVGGIQALAD